jgi:hypothetical protein
MKDLTRPSVAVKALIWLPLHVRPRASEIQMRSSLERVEVARF